MKIKTSHTDDELVRGVTFRHSDRITVGFIEEPFYGPDPFTELSRLIGSRRQGAAKGGNKVSMSAKERKVQIRKEVQELLDCNSKNTLTHAQKMVADAHKDEHGRPEYGWSLGAIILATKRMKRKNNSA